MATVSLGGTPTTINVAESTTGWTDSSVALDPDIKRQGSNSIGSILRTDLSTIYYDNGGGGSAVDLTGQHVRCWHNFQPIGFLDTEANNGMEFFMYDGTNTAYWVVYGSDTYNGGWHNTIVDADSSPDSGSYDKTIVQRWGYRFNRTGAPANKTNNFVDYIRYGDGYYATGGTSGDEIALSHIAAGDLSQGYGIVEVFEGVYFAYGELTIGNGATTTFFEMISEVLVFTESPVATGLYALLGAGSGCRIDIADSVIRSSGAGDSTRYRLDMSDSGLLTCSIVDSLITRAAACDFKSGQTITGNTFDDCQVITGGGADFGGSIFKGYEGTADTAGFIWDVGTNIATLLKDCEFEKGAAATHAIEFEVSGVYASDGIVYSGFGADESTSAAVYNALTPTLIDSYSESNQDTQGKLGAVNIAAVQEFTATAGELTSARFYLRKGGSPTGDMTCRLYASDGGSPPVPTGPPLALSKVIDASTLTASFALVQFNFDDDYTMSAATNYFIGIGYNEGDATNYVDMGLDGSSPTHSGSLAVFSTGWTGFTNLDAVFYVYRDGHVVINVSGGTTPTSKTVNVGAHTTINDTNIIEITGVSEGSRCIIQRDQDGADLLNDLAFEDDGAGAFKASAAYTYTGDKAVRVGAASSGKVVAAQQDDGGVFTDETIQANDSRTEAPNLMNLFPASPVGGDAYLFGHTEQFFAMEFDTYLAGVGAYVVTWKYWNGSSWGSLITVVDGTNGFKNAGSKLITYALPAANWTARTLGDQPGTTALYYVRAEITTGGFTTVPKGKTTRLDVTQYLRWEDAATITSSGLSVKATWVVDDIATFD